MCEVQSGIEEEAQGSLVQGGRAFLA